LKQLKAGVKQVVMANKFNGPPTKSKAKKGKSKKTTAPKKKKTAKGTAKRTAKKTAKREASQGSKETARALSVSTDSDDGSDTFDGSDDDSSMDDQGEDESSEEIEQEEVPYGITGEGKKTVNGEPVPPWRVVWLDPESEEPNYDEPTWEPKEQLETDMGDEYERLVDDFEMYASSWKRGQRTRRETLRVPVVARSTRSRRAQ
jgi:hypothetical protein